MGQALGKHHEFERQGRERQKLQGAVLVIGLEQPLHREHRGKQGGDPDDAWCNASQDLKLRSHAERKQRHRDDEEYQRHQAADAAAHRKP